MGTLGKRKPSSALAGKKAARRAPSPESKSASGESSSDDGVEGDAFEDGEEDASEEGGPSMSSEDEETEGDESDDRDDDDEEGSSSLDELDDEAFGGEDLELDERPDASSDSDDESVGAGDDEFENDAAFDDGDESDDESDDASDEDAAPKRKRGDAAASAAAARAEGGSAAFGLARAFGALVGDDAKPSSSGLPNEILPKTKKQRRVEAQARVEKRARSLEKRKKLELRERGHVVPARGVVNPASDKLERRMLQTATRGVVRLFNAVSKAQKAAADAGKRKGGTLKPKELTKGSFLAELKKSGERERAEAKKEEKKEEEGGGRGWDVLSDGYLMGRNKLKDWDKGTRTAEEEVEYEDDDFD